MTIEEIDQVHIEHRREATTEKSSAVGNADTVREVAQEMLNTSMQAVTAERINGWAMRLVEACEAALSAPPRNCDVGTAEEQAERFKKFCCIYPLNCSGCPFKDNGNTHNECAIFWLQMSYKEGGEK